MLSEKWEEALRQARLDQQRAREIWREGDNEHRRLDALRLMRRAKIAERDAQEILLWIDEMEEER